MKRWICILVILIGGSVGGLQAQSLSDDIAQFTLDVEKLTQMKSILSDMKTAYTIVSGGYEGIKSIAEGNFNMHNAFLAALLQISPVVQQYYKITRIITNEGIIVQEYQAANTRFRASGRFTDAELDEMSNTYTNLFNETTRNVSELVMVVTGGSLRMSDAQRLAAIDRIDGNVTTELKLLRSFNDNTSIQAAQRTQEQNDAGAMMGLYGITK